MSLTETVDGDAKDIPDMAELVSSTLDRRSSPLRLESVEWSIAAI